MLTLKLTKAAVPSAKWPSKIVTLLKIEENPAGRTTFDYDEDDLKFKTNKKKQTLLIEIDSPETIGTPPHPRFHMRRIEYTRPDLVEGVEHSLLDHSSNSWSPHAHGQHMPPHTKTLKLKLKIDGKDELYVKVIAWDLLKEAEVPCDPLVGNDPPKNGEADVEDVDM
jgi:hypothetical protein